MVSAYREKNPIPGKEKAKPRNTSPKKKHVVGSTGTEKYAKKIKKQQKKKVKKNRNQQYKKS